MNVALKFQVGDRVQVGAGFWTIKEGTYARVENVEPESDRPYLIAPDEGSPIRVRAHQIWRAETRFERDIL